MSQIRITLRRRGHTAFGRHHPAVEIVRYFDDVSAAAKFFTEDSYFDESYTTLAIWQVLPDGPDVRPFPGYGQGFQAGADPTREHPERKPERAPFGSDKGKYEVSQNQFRPGRAVIVCRTSDHGPVVRWDGIVASHPTGPSLRVSVARHEAITLYISVHATASGSRWWLEHVESESDVHRAIRRKHALHH